ncbi:MAG: hypothetical protein Q4G34_00960 [Micrococcus sp.]|nr:hypothetical protein [Micrococcus sp.]
MGTLRPGVRAVDIDLPAGLAQVAREAIADWARARCVAALVRPSGRVGHVHVLLAGLDPDDHALDEVCARLRRDLGGLPYGAIDPRRSGTLRTLTSPHRHGLPCSPLQGDLAVFAAALQPLAPLTPPATPKTARKRPGAKSPSPGQPDVDLEALIPRPRRRRDLPPHVATWLATGREWPITGGQDHSRSTRELITTAHMVRAGWSHDQAWTAILTAHPATMTHARGDQRRWTRSVWNRAVLENEDTPDAGEPLTGELARDLAAAHARLDEAARLRLSARARPAVLLVGDAILARMARTRSTRVPVPRRDLHEDLALSLPVIGRALTWLHDVGVIHLDRTTLDRHPARRATTSYEATLPSANPDQLIPDRMRALWENCPPSSHTPHPVAALPRSCHQILRTLRLHGSLSLQVLVGKGLLSAGVEPTASELRTVASALKALAAVDHVAVDVQGRWSLTSHGPDLEYRQAQARARAERTAAITAERTAYREARASDWSLARAVALKAQRAREVAWWHALTRDEQIERRNEAAMRYAGLPLAEQIRVREQLTARRARHGVDELDYATAWADTWTGPQWAERTAQRSAVHRMRPGPEKAAIVAAWQHHRSRWGLPRIRPTPSPSLVEEVTQDLTDSARGRDERFLQHELALPSTATPQRAER